MTISYHDAINPGTTLSLLSSLPGYPVNFSVLPHTGLENDSAGRTNSLI
jgi:hypothetical protein